MDLSPDLSELLGLFHKYNVEHVVIGAYALAFYGAPRFTGDLDILVDACQENAERIIAALDAFGFSATGLTASDFMGPDQVVQLGHPPARADILTSITGVGWKEVAAGAVVGEMGGVAVRFIGRTELIRNKRALGRHKDLADIEALGEDIT